MGNTLEHLGRISISAKILCGTKQYNFLHGTEYIQSGQLKAVPQSDFGVAT
jgi:hypothetical protein